MKKRVKCRRKLPGMKVQNQMAHSALGREDVEAGIDVVGDFTDVLLVASDADGDVSTPLSHQNRNGINLRA